MDAALAVADERGLGAVTMAAVADRVGVTPMALYRWVDGKADLTDRLVGRLLAEIPPPPSDLPWLERLEELARGVREVGRRHPSVFPLVLQHPAVTPEARTVRDLVVATLVEGGVDPARAAQVERLTSTAVLGFVVSEVGGRFRQQRAAQRDADFALLLAMLRGALHEEAGAGRGGSR